MLTKLIIFVVYWYFQAYLLTNTIPSYKVLSMPYLECDNLVRISDENGNIKPTCTLGKNPFTDCAGCPDRANIPPSSQLVSAQEFRNRHNKGSAL